MRFNLRPKVEGKSNGSPGRAIMFFTCARSLTVWGEGRAIKTSRDNENKRKPWKKNRTFSHALLCCLVFFSTIILFRRWCRWLWWGCRSSRWLAPWLVPVPHRIFRVACLYRDVFIVLIINGFSLSLSLSLSLEAEKKCFPQFFPSSNRPFLSWNGRGHCLLLGRFRELIFPSSAVRDWKLGNWTRGKKMTKQILEVGPKRCVTKVRIPVPTFQHLPPPQHQKNLVEMLGKPVGATRWRRKTR